LDIESQVTTILYRLTQNTFNARGWKWQTTVETSYALLEEEGKNYFFLNKVKRDDIQNVWFQADI
jgi:hypothetical protein